MTSRSGAVSAVSRRGGGGGFSRKVCMSICSRLLPARADDPPVCGTVREGLPYVAGLTLMAGLLWRWRPLGGLAGLVLAGGVAAFFRDPARRLAAAPTLLYAPADGAVIGV